MTTLGPYELNQIYTGDARELAKAIPDESIDLIFTDPVYDKIEDYAWLAETAVRVLKPDSACLTFYGIGYAPSTHEALSRHLAYRWRIALRIVARKEFHGRLIVTSQEMLWYEKGKSTLYHSIFDIQWARGLNNKFWQNEGNWGKGDSYITQTILAFAKCNAVVFDPFTGGGTVPAVCKMLNRNYLAFEIDPDTAALARQRVANTQLPLPMTYHEQGVLI